MYYVCCQHNNANEHPPKLLKTRYWSAKCRHDVWCCDAQRPKVRRRIFIISLAIINGLVDRTEPRRGGNDGKESKNCLSLTSWLCLFAMNNNFTLKDLSRCDFSFILWNHSFAVSAIQKPIIMDYKMQMDDSVQREIMWVLNVPIGSEQPRHLLYPWNSFRHRFLWQHEDNDFHMRELFCGLYLRQPTVKWVVAAEVSSVSSRRIGIYGLVK